MASFNKIIIVGYLGRDPELKYTPQGNAVCDFSVATTERKKDKSGEFQDQTTWFRVAMWGKQAELASQYLSKGRQVYVEGRLNSREYTDREGNTRTSLEVTGTDLRFIGSRDDAPGGMGGGGGMRAGSAPSGGHSGGGGGGEEHSSGPITDDDIPF